MSCARGCCRSSAEHFRSLGFLSAGTIINNHRDQALSKDLAAYQRLVRNGLQPKSTVGAARLEATAEFPHEVEGRPSATARI